MKKCLVTAALTAAIVIWLLSPNPPSKPLKACSACGTGNEDWRTTCIGCGASI